MQIPETQIQKIGSSSTKNKIKKVEEAQEQT